MLLLIGAIVLFLRVPIPQPVAEVAECVVGFMLVALGGLLGMKLLRERWHLHQHDHDGTRHVHLHSHAQSRDHGHAHWWRESVRPLCIGMAHGLAGSAALLLFVVASAGSVLEGLLYIAVFGCGSIAGMMLIGLLLPGTGQCRQYRVGSGNRLSRAYRRAAVLDEIPHLPREGDSTCAARFAMVFSTPNRRILLRQASSLTPQTAEID
jgi:sulfite exporter TauE/SafE